MASSGAGMGNISACSSLLVIFSACLLVPDGWWTMLLHIFSFLPSLPLSGVLSGFGLVFISSRGGASSWLDLPVGWIGLPGV